MHTYNYLALVLALFAISALSAPSQAEQQCSPNYGYCNTINDCCFYDDVYCKKTPSSNGKKVSRMYTPSSDEI